MKTITTFILLTSFFHLTAQTVEVEKLKSAFFDLQEKNNQTNQQRYFDLFPNSFEKFEQVFGFEKGKKAPLYDNSIEYIRTLFALDSISQSSQITKWIDISIGGHWDADAVNYFQHFLRTRTLKNVDLTYKLLKDRPDKEVESFFYFFFNEIHPQFETIPKEFEMLKNRDKAFYNLLEKGHHQAIEDSGH